MNRYRRKKLPKYQGSRRKLIIVVFIAATYAVARAPGSSDVFVVLAKETSRAVSAFARGTDVSPQVRVAATTIGIRH